MLENSEVKQRKILPTIQTNRITVHKNYFLIKDYFDKNTLNGKMTNGMVITDRHACHKSENGLKQVKNDEKTKKH